MSEIREELLKDLEGMRRRVNRRHECREITEEELKKGMDAIDWLKGII